VTIERVVVPAGGATVDTDRLRGRLERRLAEALAAVAADVPAVTADALRAAVVRVLQTEARDG
jgi:hypothetical protein